MDSKLEVCDRSTTGKWQVLAVTGLILASLLTTTVGVLIYISLNPGVTCAKADNGKYQNNIEEVIHLNDPVRGDMNENLLYNDDQNIAVLTSADGGFNLQDYNKGIHITKNPETGVCYVTPNNMTADEGHKFGKLIAGGNLTFNVRQNATNFNLIPGKIVDISFIPAIANNHCFEGYQWLTMSPATSGENQHTIVKRQARIVAILVCCSCGCCYWLISS